MLPTDAVTEGQAEGAGAVPFRQQPRRKRVHTPFLQEMVYAVGMGRTNIVIDEEMVKKARKLTRLKTKREIVDKALELLVRSESRKGVLKHYGTGIWKGDLKAMRRNRG